MHDRVARLFDLSTGRGVFVFGEREEREQGALGWREARCGREEGASQRGRDGWRIVVAVFMKVIPGVPPRSVGVDLDFGGLCLLAFAGVERLLGGERVRDGEFVR